MVSKDEIIKDWKYRIRGVEDIITAVNGINGIVLMEVDKDEIGRTIFKPAWDMQLKGSSDYWSGFREITQWLDDEAVFKAKVNYTGFIITVKIGSVDVNWSYDIKASLGDGVVLNAGDVFGVTEAKIRKIRVKRLSQDTVALINLCGKDIGGD
jgi:hypothetical protein